MKQEDLSKILNVSRVTVGRYETNERFPDKNILKQIADIFNVSIDYLLERTNNRNINNHSEKSFNEKNKKNIIYGEIYNDVVKALISENLIVQERYIPKEIFEDIIKYGIDAAVKIAKLKNKTEENQ